MEQNLAVRRIRQLAMAQRIVLVVGLGLALLVGWLWWYLGELPPGAGWFAYAPNTFETDTYFIVARRPVERLVVPLVLLVGWTAVSVWLLGPSPSPTDEAC